MNEYIRACVYKGENSRTRDGRCVRSHALGLCETDCASPTNADATTFVRSESREEKGKKEGRKK